MSEKIIIKVHDEEKIVVKVNEGKLVVKFGSQGLQGPIGIQGIVGPTGPTGSLGTGGTNDHATLSNLDYANSGHVGFQDKLNYISEFKAYEINN